MQKQISHIGLKSLSWFFLFTCTITASTFSACREVKQSVNKTYSAQDYIEDLRQLKSILVDNHPRPFAFQSKEDFDALANKLENEITDESKLGTFVWICRTLMASLGCGHTYMPSQGKVVWLPAEQLFPMQVAYINGDLVILNPIQNKDAINKGAVISSINGLEVEALREKFSHRISADGKNRNFKSALINESLSEYIAYELNFPQTYSIESEGRSFKLKSTKIHFPAISPVTSCPGNLCFKIREEEKIAILTIRSFHYYGKQNNKFSKFIDEAFAKINRQKIDKLIIDIRNNGGGDPYAASHLLRYIAKSDVQYYTETGLGYSDLRKKMKPFENAFAGETWILTNGKNFSTSGHFTSIVKANGFAKFAGTETGSTFTCNANQLEFVLKNTGLIGSVARTTFAAAVDFMPEDRGISVELYIPLEKEDYLNNKDGQLDKLIKHLDEN